MNFFFIFHSLKSDDKSVSYQKMYIYHTWQTLSPKHGVGVKGKSVVSDTAAGRRTAVFITFPCGFEHLSFGGFEKFSLTGTGCLKHGRDMFQE